LLDQSHEGKFKRGNRLQHSTKRTIVRFVLWFNTKMEKNIVLLQFPVRARGSRAPPAALELKVILWEERRLDLTGVTPSGAARPLLKG